LYTSADFYKLHRVSVAVDALTEFDNGIARAGLLGRRRDGRLFGGCPYIGTQEDGQKHYAIEEGKQSFHGQHSYSRHLFPVTAPPPKQVGRKPLKSLCPPNASGMGHVAKANMGTDAPYG